MKTIGILGGIGPQATMDLQERLHRVSQRLIPQHANSGYPPMVVYYLRHPPVLLNANGVPIIPLAADPRVFEAAAKLGTLCDLMIIGSNGMHVFQHEIASAAGCEVVSMVDATLSEVQRRRWQCVGVLGMGEPIIYTRPLKQLGLDFEIIDRSLRDQLDAANLRVMAGDVNEPSLTIARQALESLRARAVDGIIVGCTEIPFLIREEMDRSDLINPAQCVAEAAIRRVVADTA